MDFGYNIVYTASFEIGSLKIKRNHIFLLEKRHHIYIGSDQLFFFFKTILTQGVVISEVTGGGIVHS